MYCLKKNRLFIAITSAMSGCVTMGFAGFPATDIQQMTSLNSWSPESYRNAATDMYKKSKDAAVIDDTKNLFCKNGKQIRKISVRIDSILPKLPAGIPMDKASAITKLQMDGRKKDVRRFFEIASRRTWESLNPDSKCGQSFQTKNDIEPFGVGEDIGLIPDRATFKKMAAKPDEFIATPFLNTLRFPYKFPSWTLSGNSELRANVVYPPVKPIFVAFDKEPILMVGNVFNYYKPAKSPRSLIGCELVESLDKPNTQPREGFVYAREPARKIQITRLNEGASADSLQYYSTQDLATKSSVLEIPNALTVSNAIIAELGVLRNNYTMTIPHGVQVQNFCSDKNKGSSNKLFGVTYDGDRSYDISCMDRGVKEDGEDGWKIDVANAVKDKDLLWMQYLETMTSLKESPSKEPNTTSYTATLDLGVFCKYGRKMDELMTQ